MKYIIFGISMSIGSLMAQKLLDPTIFQGVHPLLISGGVWVISLMAAQVFALSDIAKGGSK